MTAPTITRAKVTINRIHVIDSSVNTTSEPGSSAEWRLTFIVNGQAQTWAYDEVKDNTDYVLNLVFPDVPLSPNGTVSISASGYEEDDTSANDVLPRAEATIDPVHNFNLGGTAWMSSTASPEGSYSVEYRVDASHVGSTSSPLVVAASRLLYGIKQNGDLQWYRHDGHDDGTARWTAGNGGNRVGSGWGGNRAVFSGGDGVIYAIRQNGDLQWFRHDGRTDGTFRWTAGNGGTNVGTGWTNFTNVFSGGDGVIYVIRPNGDLMWFRHDGRNDGTFRWTAGNGGNRVGTGWTNFTNVFSGGDGVIYVIRPNGDLQWFRHDGRNDGTFRWTAGNGGNRVGTGWGAYTTVFSG